MGCVLCGTYCVQEPSGIGECPGSPDAPSSREAYGSEEGKSALGHRTLGRATRKKQAQNWTPQG